MVAMEAEVGAVGGAQCCGGRKPRCGARLASVRPFPGRGGPGGVSRGAAAPETRRGALPRRAVPVPAPERSRPRPPPAPLPRGEPGLAAPVETVGVTTSPLST